MSIKLQWDSQDDLNLDSVEIYRSDKVIDLNNLPPVLATVGGKVRSYEDFTVKNNNIYHYVIATVKNGLRAFSTDQVRGYFASTGPGRTDVFRGSWDAGYFDEIPAVNFITLAELWAKVPSKVSLAAGREPTMWAKMAYKGKVIFIPDSWNFTGTRQAMYNAGLLFGTDDFGNTPSGVPGNVNQRTVIRIGGNDYILRVLRFSDLSFTTYVNATAQYINSEWKTLQAALYTVTTIDDISQQRWLDWTLGNLGICSSAHLVQSGYQLAFGNNTPDTPTNVNVTTAANWLCVLELIMP